MANKLDMGEYALVKRFDVIEPIERGRKVKLDTSGVIVDTAGLGRGAVVEASPEQATGANARVL